MGYTTHICLFATVSLTMPLVAIAQSGNQGAITGTVTDKGGAFIANASVSVINQTAGTSRTTMTDRAGFYDVESLDPGAYIVTIAAKGFKRSILENEALEPGQRRRTDALLVVGEATEQITVRDTTSQVQTESSESGGTITSAEVANLMLNGRNFQTLGQLVPGVSSTLGGNVQPGGGYGGATSLIVNGNSVEYSVYTIDGVIDMNDGSLTNINVLPIVDAIQEFSILKDNYSARYGFSGSGQIIVETKAGSTSYHGALWDYFRNSATDARNYFTPTRTALHQNIYGYSFGGPIPRLKKTLFFAANEWRSSSTGSARLGAVFTSPMRQGNFSASPTLPASGHLTLDANSQQLLASEGKGNCVSGTTVNASCFDPVASYLLATYIPQPNNIPNGFNNYINPAPVRLNQVDYNDRVDHSFTENEVLTGRAIYEQVNQQYPYDNYAGLAFNTTSDAYYTTASNLLLRMNSTLGTHWNNVASLGYTDNKIKIYNTSNNVSLPSNVTIQQSFPGADPLNRIPSISISGGYSGLGVGAQPIHATDGDGIIADDVNWVRGNHVVQFGAVYIFGIKHQNVFTLPQGSFGFSGTHTGDPAADFLLGLDSGYSQVSQARSGAFHYRQGESYVQDNWKVTPRLTFNLGLRWYYFSPDTVSGDMVTNFDPNTYSTALAPVVTPTGTLLTNAANQPITSTGTLASSTNGLVFAGQDGTPSGFFNAKKANFAPRIGFAYAIGSDNKTSVHGGYGIGYTRLALSQVYNLFGSNPPYVKGVSILNSLLSNGTAGTGATPTTQTLYGIVASQRPAAQTQNFSFTLEREIIPNGIFTAAYAGSLSRHLETTYYDQNEPLSVNAPSVAGCLPASMAVFSHYQYDPCINTGKVSGNYTRPYLGYSTIQSQAFPGSGNYNSLQGGFTYRTTPLQLNIAYTYSKALANIASRKTGGASSTTNAQVQDWRNLSAEYGLPDFDRTHVFVTSIIYNLPWFNSAHTLLRTALGGWSLAGLTILESGYAMSPSTSYSTAGLSTRPNLVAPIKKIGTKAQWFSTASFAAPAYGFYGNAGNGSIRGPSELTGNVALYKAFPIRDKFTVQFRAEAFNVANHTNFAAVSTAYGSANFGQVTSALDPRILEFAIRMTF
jgi:hypothetical protein